MPSNCGFHGKKILVYKSTLSKSIAQQLHWESDRLEIWYSMERKLYELLGVRQFRKLVFWLERQIHRKDKGKNINYHLGLLTPDALDAFTKYLFFNGTIHARNIVFALLYALLRVLLGHRMVWFDILVILLTVKDIYCLMLQRYNFLRIQEREARLEVLREKKISQRSEKIIVTGLEDYDMSKRDEDLALIHKLRNGIQSKETILLSEADIEGLKRLKKLGVL